VVARLVLETLATGSPQTGGELLGTLPRLRPYLVWDRSRGDIVSQVHVFSLRLVVGLATASWRPVAVPVPLQAGDKRADVGGQFHDRLLHARFGLLQRWQGHQLRSRRRGIRPASGLIGIVQHATTSCQHQCGHDDNARRQTSV